MTDQQARQKGYISARHYERVQQMNRKEWWKTNKTLVVLGLMALVFVILAAQGQANRVEQMQYQYENNMPQLQPQAVGINET